MKLRLLIIMLLAICQTAMTQVKLGVKAGPTIGALIGKVDRTTSSGTLKVGYHGGLYAEIPISGKLAFRPGIQYSRFGLGYVEDRPRTDTTQQFIVPIIPPDTFLIPTFYTAFVQGEYKLQSLRIPLKIQYKLSDRMQVNTGFSFNFLLKGENTGTQQIDIGERAGQQAEFESEEAYVDALYTRSFMEFDEGSSIRKFDVQYSLGSQYRLYKGLHVYFDANLGLGHMQPATVNLPISFRSFSMQVGLAYNFYEFSKWAKE